MCQALYLHAVWSQANNFSSLNLTVLIYILKKKIPHAACCVDKRRKRDTKCFVNCKVVCILSGIAKAGYPIFVVHSTWSILPPFGICFLSLSPTTLPEGGMCRVHL